MIRKLFAVAAALFLTSGCYHVTVVTGGAASPTHILKPWQLSFVDGLVPPPEVHAEEECRSGVAKVETKRSLMNGFVSFLSGAIVTPITLDVTCASMAPAPDGQPADGAEPVEAPDTGERDQPAGTPAEKVLVREPSA